MVKMLDNNWPNALRVMAVKKETELSDLMWGFATLETLFQNSRYSLSWQVLKALLNWIHCFKTYRKFTQENLHKFSTNSDTFWLLILIIKRIQYAELIMRVSQMQGILSFSASKQQI